MTSFERSNKANGFAPVKLLVKLAAVCAVGCVAGLLFLRWVFWRDLGQEYAQTFYTLKSMSHYLVPTLALSFLMVLFVASITVFAVAVFASHRVAGPIFRLQRVGEHLDKWILVGRIVLRNGDWFLGVAGNINAWVQKKKEYHHMRRQWADHAHNVLREVKVSAGQGDYEKARASLREFLREPDAG